MQKNEKKVKKSEFFVKNEIFARWIEKKLCEQVMVTGQGIGGAPKAATATEPKA